MVNFNYQELEQANSDANVDSPFDPDVLQNVRAAYEIIRGHHRGRGSSLFFARRALGRSGAGNSEYVFTHYSIHPFF